MANKSISQLDPGSAVAGTDLFPDVQTPNVGPVKVTASQLGDYFLKGTYTSNTLVYDSTNSRIGIGTASPSEKLTVAGSIFGYNSSTGSGELNFSTSSANDANRFQIRYQSDGGGTFYILKCVDSQPLVFGTSNTERIRITSAGIVGVGITPSNWDANAIKALQVVGANFAGDNGGTYRARVLANAYYNSGYIYQQSNYATMYAQDSATGQHQWYAAPSGTAGNAITFTQAMTLDASGNLGVGPTSPAAKLDVNGNIKGAQIYSTPTALTSGATITWNANTSPVASLTLNDTGVTVSISNLIAGSTYLLIITQGAAGSRIVSTWTTTTGSVAWKWAGGAPPTLSTSAGAIDIITAYTDGTTVYASAQYGFA